MKSHAGPLLNEAGGVSVRMGAPRAADIASAEVLKSWTKRASGVSAKIMLSLPSPTLRIARTPAPHSCRITSGSSRAPPRSM